MLLQSCDLLSHVTCSWFHQCCYFQHLTSIPVIGVKWVSIWADNSLPGQWVQAHSRKLSLFSYSLRSTALSNPFKLDYILVITLTRLTLMKHLQKYKRWQYWFLNIYTKSEEGIWISSVQFQVSQYSVQMWTLDVTNHSTQTHNKVGSHSCTE